LTVPAREVGISAVTEAELRFGVAKRPEGTRLNVAVHEFLLRVEIMPWDSEAARSYAEIRSGPQREGKPLWNLDLMIADTRWRLRACVLVTHDQTFQRVKGLKLADWTR
jgi:tRNA(fMet)-specific endonuclease VapC